MRPSRWIPAISILSLLFLAPALPTASAQGRVLKVKAVADEAYRERKNWEKEIQEHIEWSDKEFRKMAGIGLALVGIDRWTTHQTDDMALLLNELHARVDKGDADIVVGFTGHMVETQLIGLGEGDVVQYRPSAILGMALLLGDRTVVRRDEDKKETRHTMLHEIGHLFGGLHVKEKSILLTYAGQQEFSLDPFNRRVFEIARDRDFNQSIREVDRQVLDALIAAYRQRPLRDERDFDTNIRVGYLLLARGDVDDAIKEFEEATRIDPGATYRVLRGLIIPQLEAYFEDHGGTVESRYLLGRAHATINDWGKAGSQFMPNCFTEGHAPSCSELGGILIQAKRLDSAEQALQRALELDESLVRAHNNLGIVYSIQGKTDEAVEHFNRAIELKPDDASVHFNVGVAYLNLDMLEPAENSFRRAAEIDSDNLEARSRLAVTLARKGNGKEAENIVRELEKTKQVLDFGSFRFEIERLTAASFRDMAEVCYRTGDEKKAWKFLNEAKKKGLNVTELEQQMMAGSAKAPKKVKTDDLVEQAEAYYDEKKYDLARKTLEQAKAQDPKKEEVHYWLGRVARAQGKADEATQHQQAALAAKDKYAAPYLELARMAVDRRDYPTAAGHLKQYVNLEGRNPEGRFLLGLCQYKLGDMAGAESSLKEAIRMDTEYGDAFYLLGALYARQERKQEAIAELSLAVETRTLRQSWRPEAHYNLAVLLLETGKHDLAWKHAHTAQRTGHGNVGWVLEDLAKAAPEPKGSPSEPPAATRNQPEAMMMPPYPPGKDYHLSEVELGEPPGTVRRGKPSAGILRYQRRGGTGGRLAVSLRIGPTDSKTFTNWSFFSIEVPEDEEEGELEFFFMLPPNLPSEGEFRALVSVATPPAPGAMPKALSNEVEVKFRVGP